MTKMATLTKPSPTIPGAIELNENWGMIDVEGNYWGLGSALYNRGLIYESYGKTALAQRDFQAAALEKQALKQTALEQPKP